MWLTIWASYRLCRARALISPLTYSFARITAALKMKVEDLPAARRRMDDRAG
jgi:hypothetical protein